MGVPAAPRPEVVGRTSMTWLVAGGVAVVVPGEAAGATATLAASPEGAAALAVVDGGAGTKAPSATETSAAAASVMATGGGGGAGGGGGGAFTSTGGGSGLPRTPEMIAWPTPNTTAAVTSATAIPPDRERVAGGFSSLELISREEEEQKGKA